MGWAFYDSQGKQKSAVSAPAVTLDKWHVVGGAGEPAFQNSWANTAGGWPPLAFRKDAFGMVHIRGTVTTGTTGTVIFTLPAGYRPPTALPYQIVLDDGTRGFLSIATDGTVTGFRSSGNLYIMDVEFDTETVFQAAGGPAGSLGQPDWDSGWFAETNATAHGATIFHNLGLLKPPSNVEWWFAPTSPQTNWYLLNLPNMKVNPGATAADPYSNPGSVVWSTNALTYYIYNLSNLYSHYNGGWQNYATGFYRIYLWR